MSSHSTLALLPSAIALHFSRRPRVYVPVGTVAAIIIFLVFLLLLPPQGFPTNEPLVIEAGVPFSTTVKMLEDQHVVNSAFALQVLARIGGADERIQAGTYEFERPLGLTTILHRLAHGVSGIPLVKVTFPEGTTAREMRAILEAALPSFDGARFESLAKAKEGYLFPDTYHLKENTTPEEVVALLQNTFFSKTETIRIQAASSGRTLEEIVTMASLIEREAMVPEDRRMISGILWKRVDQGRALQVDAVFGYIKGTATFHPSLDDLEIDSPYNTYRYPGLPPGPIANPGLDALLASLTPTQNEYLYYLTGKDGNMYYAKTFEEHKENRARYLD